MNSAVDCAVFVRETVVIAESNEWTKLQLHVDRTWCVDQFILDNGRVLALRHEQLLLNFDTLHAECENRKRIQSELPQKLEALRMHRAGVAVGSKLVRAAVDRQSFFKFREQNESAYRRFGRSN